MTPLNRAQFLCFVLVWFSYASTYLLRKPLGVVKADLGAELGVINTDAEGKQPAYTNIYHIRWVRWNWVGVTQHWSFHMLPSRYSTQALLTGALNFGKS